MINNIRTPSPEMVDKHMVPCSSGVEHCGTGQATASLISKETSTILQLEQARREVEELIQDDSVDGSVRQAAARRLKRAEMQYQQEVFNQAQLNVHEEITLHQREEASPHRATKGTIPGLSKEIINSKNTETQGGESEHNPILTNDPVELARITSNDAAFLDKQKDEVDECVIEAALRKSEKAIRSLSQNDGGRRDDKSDEETSSGFEDSSLLEPFETNGQRVTIELIPISDDIDLEALGGAISEIEREEQWLKSQRVTKSAVGSRLVLRLNKAVRIKEVDWICDRLTDEFPDDIQSLEVKFHPNPS